MLYTSLKVRFRGHVFDHLYSLFFFETGARSPLAIQGSVFRLCTLVRAAEVKSGSVHLYCYEVVTNVVRARGTIQTLPGFIF